ncbi:hypothetical protein BH23ACT9_BH23ACT9_15460 [soil metagenome]
MTFDLKWAQTGDYDLFVFDGAGVELARSADANIEDPDVDPLGESLFLNTVGDCSQLHVVVRSWAGGPQPLTLDLTVSNLRDAVDPDLNERVDARSTHYLGGARPGQVAMLHGDPNNLPTPLQSGLVSQRPTGAQPNSHTRTLVGFNNPRNLLQSHFTAPVSAPTRVTGAPAVQVWLSTPAQDLPAEQRGTFFVRVLFDDVDVAAPIAIPAAAVNPWPTPFLVEFPTIDRTARTTITVQVSAEPVASSNGDTSPAGNGVFTLWYDSVQYPSRLVLP